MITQHFTGHSGVGVLVYDIFEGLDGDQLFASLTDAASRANDHQLLGTGNAGRDDGVFSTGFRISSGALDLTAHAATATVAGSSVTISVVPAAVVHEPATLALLFGCLAGLGIARRRARGRQSAAV